MVLMVAAASGASVSISSFLYARRTLESSSWITRWRHCRLKDSISTEEFFHREECTPLCSLIFVFKSVRKVSKKSLKKKYQVGKVPTLESYEKKKKGRWISFNLKAKVSGRKFIFNESTNEIWIFRASSIALLRARREPLFFSLDTFYLVISDVVGEDISYVEWTTRAIFFFNSPLFHED